MAIHQEPDKHVENDNCRCGCNKPKRQTHCGRGRTGTEPLTKLARIEIVIQAAEEWSRDQVMEESQIAIAALKDIRRIVREK